MRSTAELVALTNSQWSQEFAADGLFAILADTTGAATQPTASSSFAVWESFFCPDNDGLYLYAYAQPGASIYNSANGRAEVPPMTFSDFELNLYAPAGTTTVTHVIITNALTAGRIMAVIEESPALSINSSSTLSYTLNAWGEYA
jgi:hypothetical protein